MEGFFWRRRFYEKCFLHYVRLRNIGLFKADEVSASLATVCADSASFRAFDYGTKNPFSSLDTSN